MTEYIEFTHATLLAPGLFDLLISKDPSPLIKSALVRKYKWWSFEGDFFFKGAHYKGSLENYHEVVPVLRLKFPTTKVNATFEIEGKEYIIIDPSFALCTSSIGTFQYTDLYNVNKCLDDWFSYYLQDKIVAICDEDEDEDEDEPTLVSW